MLVRSFRDIEHFGLTFYPIREEVAMVKLSPLTLTACFSAGAGTLGQRALHHVRALRELIYELSFRSSWYINLLAVNSLIIRLYHSEVNCAKEKNRKFFIAP